MSIIYDALKKTQTKFFNQEQRKKGKNYLIWFGIIFIFLGFLGCGFALMLLLRSTPSKTLISEVGHKNNAQNRIASRKFFIIPKSTEQQLTLNGIISMEGEYLALINNQILREGDYVQDKRIISISKDKVELYSKGKLIVLTQK